jgi:hypothetical protein
MADGRDQAPGFSFRATFPWMEIFRCFQIAIDPRKLLVAALGILTMSFGWYILSAVFYYPAPTPSDPKYQTGTIAKEYEGKTKSSGEAYGEQDWKEIANQRFATDFAQWRVLSDLAGPYGKTAPDSERPLPPGRFRAMPWDEYRGPNPFLLVTTVLSGSPAQRTEAVGGFLSGSVPVLVEPLVKLLVPVTKIVAPGVSGQTRIYLFFLLFWEVAVWAFFGGIITRIAAVQLANKGPISLRQATTFVANRYINYLLSPLVPMAIIAVIVIGLIVYGLLALIPVFGDLVMLGLLLPLVILGGGLMALFLVGLVGYPLMYPTLSVEGDSSDTFDALSRSINYVYQSPWHYIWYWLVAIVYGAAVTFFVLFFTSMMLYLGKWAVGIPAHAVWSDREPEFLFIYSPESFGWKELLLENSPYAVEHGRIESMTGRPVDVYRPENARAFEANRSQFYVYNTWGAGIVAFWLALLFLMMLGFSYSFFWSAATIIYYLMRRKVDEAELDEVFLEEEEPESPLAPPKIAEGTSPATAGTSLPVVNSPVAPPPPPPPITLASPPPPPPPIPLVSPPPSPPMGTILPPADGETKKDGENPL